MAEEQTTTVATPAPGGKKKLILFGLIGLLVIGGGAFAAFTMMKADAPAEEESEEVVEVSSSGPPIYQSLHPPLVVNFKDQAGDSHFMQITMEVMSRKQSVINAVREHTPAIRNSLILLYGGAVFEDIQSREGKEKMLADGREEIARIVAENSGEKGVEALYFTALVIQ